MHYLASRRPGTLRLCFGPPGCCSALQSAPLIRKSDGDVVPGPRGVGGGCGTAASSRSGLSGRPAVRRSWARRSDVDNRRDGSERQCEHCSSVTTGLARVTGPRRRHRRAPSTA